MTRIVGNKEWDGVPMPRRLGAIVALGFGLSLTVLNGNITYIALPTFQEAFSISPADTIWIVNSYQLTIVMLLLSLSSIADRWSYRKLYLLGVAIFSLGSLGCAISVNFGMLIVSRIVQGIGAACVMSINSSIMRTIFPKNRLARGLSINTTIVSIAAVSGPTIASVVMARSDWHWLFGVNVPIGLVALVLGYFFIPDNPMKIKGEKFRWYYGLLNALTFGLFLTMIEGYSHGWSIHIIIVGLIATFVVGCVYVKSQLKEKYPMLPFDLLHIPIFTLSLGTSICSFIATSAALTATPFLLQHDMGFSAAETGMIIVAWPAVMGIAAPFSGILAERIHPGYIGLFGLTITSIGLFCLATTPQDATIPDIVWRLMVCSCGIGFFQAPNNSLLIGSAPAERSGSATGMQATARLIGQTAGAALVALTFTMFQEDSARYAIYTACAFALLGAILSSTRIGFQLPPALQKRKRQ